MTKTITINGSPYTATYHPAQGKRAAYWQVVSNTKPTDHFYRNYVVRLWPNGKPKSCTCPAFDFCPCKRCKHMDAIDYTPQLYEGVAS